MRPLGHPGYPGLGLIVLALVGCSAWSAHASEANVTGPSSRAAGHAASERGHSPITAELEQSAAGPTAQAPEDRGRRLSPTATPGIPVAANRLSQDRGASIFRDFADGSAVTAAAALAFVVGLFTLFAWVVKRSMPKSSQLLPAEAVRVLGRVPLGARQFGHLLQLGNKLVLVNVTQAGVEKLAEIDDREEVLRLLQVCSTAGGKGSQKEFEEIFGQFAKQPAEPGFLGSEGSLFGNAGNTGGRRYA